MPLRPPSRTAAVFGGGIGGLAAAAALCRSGWHVDVYERSATLPATGTALGMWPSAQRALDVLGVHRALEASGVEQRTGLILSREGRVIGRIDSSRRPVLLASRPLLLELLADAVPAASLHLGTSAPPLEQLGDRDLVVAADGIWSGTRESLFGRRSEPRPLNMVAWRGWVDGEAARASESWGPGALFGITGRDGGLTNWFAAVRTPLAPDRSLDALRARYAGWHAGVQEVLARVMEGTTLFHELYESPPLPTYVHGHVALLGDAAHAMAPNLGRGACEAIIDGVALATHLDGRTVEDGLRRYDRARRLRTQVLVAASRTMGRLATATVGVPLGNALLGSAMRLA